MTGATALSSSKSSFEDRFLKETGEAELKRLARLTINRLRQSRVPLCDKPHVDCRHGWDWLVYEMQWGFAAKNGWLEELVIRTLEKSPPRIGRELGIAATYVALSELNEFDAWPFWFDELEVLDYEIYLVVCSRVHDIAQDEKVSFLNREGWLREPCSAARRLYPSTD